MARRAYATEDKNARRRAILTAAGDLFVAGSGELPAVAQIARAAGLAKGTVYIYFRTKGAIFASILQEGWGEVVDDLEGTFRPAGGARADKVAAFLSGYVGHVVHHPELLQLDSLGHGVLERNLEKDALLAFKRALLDRLVTGGTVLEEALGLSPGRGLQLLTRTYAMTRGLWQSLDLSPAAAQDASTPHQRDFGPELLDALSEYWRGALATS
jgi:AcrR family transcriptional regulator